MTGKKNREESPEGPPPRIWNSFPITQYHGGRLYVPRERWCLSQTRVTTTRWFFSEVKSHRFCRTRAVTGKNTKKRFEAGGGWTLKTPPCIRARVVVQRLPCEYIVMTTRADFHVLRPLINGCPESIVRVRRIRIRATVFLELLRLNFSREIKINEQCRRGHAYVSGLSFWANLQKNCSFF